MSDAELNDAENKIYSPKRLLDLLDVVCDQDTFLNFVDALSQDADEADEKREPGELSPNGWEHGTIGSFLDAVVRCSDGKRDRFSQEPSWKTFAEMLYGGKIYE